MYQQLYLYTVIPECSRNNFFPQVGNQSLEMVFNQLQCSMSLQYLMDRKLPLRG